MNIHHLYRTAVLSILCLAAIASGQNYFGQPTPNTHVLNILNAVTLDSLQKFVQQLSGVLPVNPKGIPVNLTHRRSTTMNFRTAADFIAMQFNTYGLNPVKENDTSPWSKTNVIGTLPGASGEYVIVCGHFDSACNTCPGADDNASGTAALLEAARILKGYAFQRTIKFIAFGGEEQGLLGSKAYVQQHPNDSIYAVLNCDMIMWDGDADMVATVHTVANDNQQYSYDLGKYVMRVDTIYNIPTECVMYIPGSKASDHASFWNADRSALMLIEEIGSDFNPYYHTSGDSWANLAGQQHQELFYGISRLVTASAAHLAGILQPVPVEFLFFTADADVGKVQLRWITVLEKNNAGFTVERRLPGETLFRSIGFLAGAGNSIRQVEYVFQDDIISRGRIEYRLKQQDNDGAIQYSPIAEVFIAGVNQAALLEQNYPNPFGSSSLSGSASTTIAFWLRDPGYTTVEVFDPLGRRVATPVAADISAGRHEYYFSSAGLPSGVYFYRLSQNGKTLALRNMTLKR